MLGVSMSYHRQLSHKSFRTPKVRQPLRQRCRCRCRRVVRVHVVLLLQPRTRTRRVNTSLQQTICTPSSAHAEGEKIIKHSRQCLSVCWCISTALHTTVLPVLPLPRCVPPVWVCTACPAATRVQWLEFFLAYCGALAFEGDPIEWSKNHRWHHQNSDSAADRHSPRDGLWHAHMGWLFDESLTNTRCGCAVCAWRQRLRKLNKLRGWA